MTETDRITRVRVLSRRIHFQGFGAYEEIEVEQPLQGGGSLRLSREFQRRTDVVAVLPYDPARAVVLLARQLRVPIHARGDQDGYLIEAPAGHIDAGETAEQAARREALEEVGVVLGPLDHVGNVFSSPGALTERLSLFLAAYDAQSRHGGGGGVTHEGEEIEVLEWPLAGLEARLGGSAGVDAKTLLLLQALRLRRPDLPA